jgi:hypothetical protein
MFALYLNFLNKMRTLVILLSIIAAMAGCTPVRVTESVQVPEVEKTREAKLLTAFFGLDNGLNLKALRISRKAYKKDGMPLVFSQELNPKTMQASDFEITTKSGSKHTPVAVSLLPANEAFELRTVLLIGEYGSAKNPPVTVKIVGDLMSRSGKNFKGQSIKVIPLEEGPILSYAEYFTFDKDYPYVRKGRGCDCPKDKTKMVVKVVWAGGVRAVDKGQLGANELKDFEVTMVQGNDTLKVKPFQLADLKDNDNNIDLCLKETGVPIWVKVNANIAIDPRGDKNPQTQIKVVSRW